MIHFTEEKMLSSLADVFEVAVQEQGYVLLSKELYDDLLLTTEPTFALKANSSARSFYENTVPNPLKKLGFLLDRLTFDIDENLEDIFGALNIILTFSSLKDIIGMTQEKFEQLRYSDMILKESILPRRMFLTSCVPYEDLINHEAATMNKHQFLYLAPMGSYGGSGVPVPGITGQDSGYGGGASAVGMEMDPENFHYYIDRKENYKYLGDGMFLDIAAQELLEIGAYDEELLNKVFEYEAPEPETPAAIPAAQEPPPSAVSSTFAPSDTLAEGNTETQMQVASAFQTFRERRGV